MPAITSEVMWGGLVLIVPQRGDILIKKVFHDRIFSVEGQIVRRQRSVKQQRFDQGHESAEHAAVVIGENFVAEAEAAGVVANSLATSDRATTKYVVYRCVRPLVASKAAQVAETVARKRGKLTVDRSETGGGYKIAGAAGSLQSTGQQSREIVPYYVQNLISYCEGRTNHRQWAFCSMFACACFEAACVMLARQNRLRESVYHGCRLKVDPSNVSPREYEHWLETNPNYQQVGRFIFAEGGHDLAIKVFETIRQAVEDYKKTLGGGGTGGWQAAKSSLGLRSMSAESQNALQTLDAKVTRCAGVARGGVEFRSEVDKLYMLVLFYIGAPYGRIARQAFSDGLREELSPQFYESPQWRHQFDGMNLVPLKQARFYQQSSTFLKILEKCNDDLRGLA